MSLIKKLISVFTSSKEESIKNSKDENIDETFLNKNARDFLDGKRTSLNAQEAFPHLKVFQPVKTPKNASLTEVNARLDNAISYLHLPAAYKDILISLRMIIRIKRKKCLEIQSELKTLYKYACQYNFFNAEPYLKKAHEPAFNLEEVIDKDYFNTLPIPYSALGYKKITELNKTDVKWLVSEFGEPKSHNTVAQFHRTERDNLEKLLISKREKESKAIWNYNKNN
jgi:hypothetical protein